MKARRPLVEVAAETEEGRVPLGIMKRQAGIVAS